MELQPSLPSRESQFLNSYSSALILTRLPDLSNSLARTEISPSARSQLVNWLFEASSKLIPTDPHSCELVFTRTIHLMDLYFKKAPSPALREDVLHLLGVTCLFVSMKAESVDTGTLTDFCAKTTRGAITSLQVQEQEFKLVASLSFYVSFTTWAEACDFLFHKVGAKLPLELAKHIRSVAGFVLMALTYNPDFNNHGSITLILSSILVAFKYVLNEAKAKNKPPPFHEDQLTGKLLADFRNNLPSICRGVKIVKKGILHFFELYKTQNMLMASSTFEKTYFV